MFPPRIHSEKRGSSPIVWICAILLSFAAQRTEAATSVIWSGTASSDFEASANWSALPANDLTSNVATFSGSSAFQPQLSKSRSVDGLAFSTSTGGWTLGGSSAFVLSVGNGGINSTGQTSGANNISAALALGASQTWSVGTGGAMVFTGSITSASGVGLTVNATGNNGCLILSPAPGSSINYSGYLTSGNLVGVRSGGVLMLGGTGALATTSTNIIANATASANGTWAITGSGKVQVNSGTWYSGDLGKNGSDAFFGALDIQGGTLSLTGARFLGSGTLTLEGGALLVSNTGSAYGNGGRFSLGSVGSTGTAVLTVSGGLLDLAQANSGNTLGVTISTLVQHNGGTVRSGITPGGGPNGGTANGLTLGASGSVSNSRTAYTLSGSGVLIVAGILQGGAVTTGTNDVTNFNFNGGTLSAGTFDATNIGYCSATGSAGGSAYTTNGGLDATSNSVGKGTLANNGGIIAPATDGSVGTMVITGGLAVNSGGLSVDVSGSGAADLLRVSGTAVIGGSLIVNAMPGYTPSPSDQFTILTAAAVTGSFTNLSQGSRVLLGGSTGFFTVSQTGTTVSLGGYAAATAPAITAAPASGTVNLGGTLALSVTVSSFAPVTYQWYKDGSLITGATNASFTLSNVGLVDQGNYLVVVTNVAGATTSPAASIAIAAYDAFTLGDQPIAFDFTNVQPISRTPATGIHPRLYFNAEDAPDILNRLQNTAVGREAWAMVQLYANMMVEGGSSAYSPHSFTTMPDGSSRLSNPGLYDQSIAYANLLSGTATWASFSTSKNIFFDALSGEMVMEAFQCYLNKNNPTYAQRAANLAQAMDAWAQIAVANNQIQSNPNTFGDHQMALAYDLNYWAMNATQRMHVLEGLIQQFSNYRNSYGTNGYYGTGLPPQGTTGNWCTLDSFKFVVAAAIEGDIDTTQFDPGFVPGFGDADTEAFLNNCIDSQYKFMTCGWHSTGASYEGQGKDYAHSAQQIILARRGYNLFGHPHFRAYADFWMPAVIQPYGYSCMLYDILGGTGFDAEKGKILLIPSDYIGNKWMYPASLGADFSWSNYIYTQYLDTPSHTLKTFLDLRDTKFTIRSPYVNDLLPAAVFASDPFMDISSGTAWATANQAVLGGNLDFFDNEGGTLISRSGFDLDATLLTTHIRQNFGGHTEADRNSFNLSALGRIFVPIDTGGTSDPLQQPDYHSVITVDGSSMWVTAQEGNKMRIPSKVAAVSPLNGQASFITGDATYAYSVQWWWAPYATGSSVSLRNRNFIPEMNCFNHFRRSDNQDPFASGTIPFVNYPRWDAANKLEGIQETVYQPMAQVYRTIGMVRGVKPYVMVVDDTHKDSSPHDYKWLASIANDLNIVTGTAVAQYGCVSGTDVVLVEPAGTGTGGAQRCLLVRILRANGTQVLGTGTTVQGAPLAYTEVLSTTASNWSWKRLVVERNGTADPQFLVMLYPFRLGDPIPSTAWTSGSAMTVSLQGQVDAFSFYPRSQAVAGQTVTMNEFTLVRGGSNTLMDYRNQIEPAPVRSGSTITLTAITKAPSGLSCVPLSETQMQLTWTNNDPNPQSWLVERSPAGLNAWVPVAAALPPAPTTFIDTTVSRATTYDYRIRCSGTAGLSDYIYVTGTTVADLGDGIPGVWRLRYFGNGTSVIPGVSGPNDDPDHDGVTNLQEYLAGTNPLDGASRPEIVSVALKGSDAVLTFVAGAGRKAVIESAPMLSDSAWTTVSGTIDTTGGNQSWTHPGGALASRGFYRLSVRAF